MDKSEEVATVKSGCSFCGEPDPGKKCSKNHSRCKGKLFCKKKSEKNCELAFHKMEQAAQAKALENERNKAEDTVEVDENKIKLAKEFEAAAKEEKARLKKAKKKNGKTTKRIYQK